MSSGKDIAVVIMSCDKYHDLWDPFFYFFEKYWPDCPYPVYLATNSKIYVRKNVGQLFSTITGTWSEETLEVLKQLHEDYFIYLQDDYFLLKKVENKKINEIVDKMIGYNADYIRLFPSPGPDTDHKNDPELGSISNDAMYRTSLQCAIWKKEAFIALLNNQEDQWQFEINAGKRSHDRLFLSVKNKTKGHIKDHTYPITYYYLTAVIRGKWRWEAAKICKKENVILDTKYRQIESYSEMLYQKIYHASPLFVKKSFDFIINKVSPSTKK